MGKKSITDNDGWTIITKSAEEDDFDAPKDRYFMVYMIFIFIGIGTLLPWTFYLTAAQYFQYQLRNKSLPSDVNPLLPIYQTTLQMQFPSFLSMASMIPMALMNFVNLMIKDCFSAYIRVLLSAALMFAMFIITTILTVVDLETNIFFIITLTTAAICNAGASVNQGSIYGILATLPTRNISAFVEGQAYAAIIAAIASLIVIASTNNLQAVGFGFFLIATCMIVISIILFLLLHRLAYFRHYWELSESKQTKNDDSICTKLRQAGRHLWTAMVDVRWMGISLFLNSAVTLSLFPSIFIQVVPNNFDPNSEWHTKYFHAVMVFLVFSVSDLTGRLFFTLLKWPKWTHKKTFLFMVLSRLVFVPLTMLCNLNSRRIPIVFYHDAVPGILTALLALTNGYNIALGVNYAPKYASPGNEEGCGIAISTYLTVGLAVGCGLTYGLIALV